MSRYKLKAIDPNACQCCLVNIASETHHRQPKSQNGGEEPENKARVCTDCHRSYHSFCMTLANTAKARVRNFVTWLAQWPGTEMELCGKKKGSNPFIMAPEFVHTEWVNASVMGETDDLSEGRLSNIGRVQEYPVRPHLRGGE